MTRAAGPQHMAVPSSGNDCASVTMPFAFLCSWLVLLASVFGQTFGEGKL